MNILHTRMCICWNCLAARQEPEIKGTAFKDDTGDYELGMIEFNGQIWVAHVKHLVNTSGLAFGRLKPLSVQRPRPQQIQMPLDRWNELYDAAVAESEANQTQYDDSQDYT